MKQILFEDLSTISSIPHSYVQYSEPILRHVFEKRFLFPIKAHYLY